MMARGCTCHEVPCSCCAGTLALTPADICNRPGLPALKYRVGTHGQFLATMKAELASYPFDEARPLAALRSRDPADFSIALLDGWACVGEILTFYQERIANEGYLRTATERRSVLELARLTGYTLKPGVAATAWVSYTIDEQQADPVTIPAGARSQSVPGPGQTAQAFETEKALVARARWNTLGPRLTRPQLAADVLGSRTVVLKGTRTNLKANDALLIGRSPTEAPQPYRVVTVIPDAPNDRTTVTFIPWPPPLDAAASPAAPAGGNGQATGTTEMSEKVRSSPGLASANPGWIAKPVDPLAMPAMAQAPAPPSLDWLGRLDLVSSAPTTKSPAGTRLMARAALARPQPSAEFTVGARLAAGLHPVAASMLEARLVNAVASPRNPLTVYAPRTKAALFGSAAPPKVQPGQRQGLSMEEWGYVDMVAPSGAMPAGDERASVLNLDSGYDKIVEGDWVMVDMTAIDWNQLTYFAPADGSTRVLVAQVARVDVALGRFAYGMSGKSTRLVLKNSAGADAPWFSVPAKDAMSVDHSFQLIRRTTVYTQCEELELAQVPIAEAVRIDDPAQSGQPAWIELDGDYGEDFAVGRPVVIRGELDSTWYDKDGKHEIPNLTGAEVATITAVHRGLASARRQGEPFDRDFTDGDEPLPDEKLHTFVQITLTRANTQKRANSYVRVKVQIYANVVRVSQGETRSEILGSGDGSQPLQSFALKQPPLTHTASRGGVGVTSTLHVYVDDLEWAETPSLFRLGPKDRGYIVRTDDSGRTAVVFGTGEHGARPPTGTLNVRAVYRNGIGTSGNVAQGQITTLQTKPLGVRAVTNPLASAGGIDSEDRDSGRRNAPLSVMPLDRLVGVQDYQDYALAYAGIAKALAVKVRVDRHTLIGLTVAAVDDAPIPTTSDLLPSLIDALRERGDPALPVHALPRALVALVLKAGIAIQPGMAWTPISSAVRKALLDVFGFNARELGQPAVLSQIVAVMQGVPGVAYVVVRAFGSVVCPADPSLKDFIKQMNDVLQAQGNPPAGVASGCGGPDPDGVLKPAELLVFLDTVPESLVLELIP